MTEYNSQDSRSFKQTVHLRPDLCLHIAEFKPRENMKAHFVTGAGPLRFSFLRDGRGEMDWRVSTGSAVTKKVLQIERSSSVSFYPEFEAAVCFAGGHRQSHFTVQISPTLLNTLLGGRFQQAPYDLQAIFSGCRTIDFYHSGPISPVMDSVISQFLDCPYSGALGQIYREGKAIELIAHKLAQIVSCPGTAPASTKMSPNDIERVLHAREILIRDLEDPPRLFELARAVGTSHTLLNRGFRKMYGAGVFGYLRKMRLEEARRLLEEGNMNVTEAALAVGYNSMSSFSRAFSAHFGSKPLSVLKNGGAPREQPT